MEKNELLAYSKNAVVAFLSAVLPSKYASLIMFVSECFSSSAILRQKKWFFELSKRIDTIDKETEQKMAKMANFASVLASVQRNALEDLEEDKVSLYVNTIINIIKNENIQDIQKHMFLNTLRDFTLLHVEILKILKEIQDTWKEPINQNRPDYLIEYFKQNFPEIVSNNNFKYVLADLENKNCCMIFGGTSFENTNDILTKYGSDFLDFISG